MKKALSSLLWIAVILLGTGAYLTLAFRRAEPVNSVYILIAALCTYAIGYRFYSKWIATRIFLLNDRRATPCQVHEDGTDFVKTNRWIVFGHHFAAISGPGPLVGPVLAAQFGYLPSALWILIGVVLGGAVQDFTILFCSLRRDGKSLGQMVKEELNSAAGYIALAAILAIMVILLAVLALVVVQALAQSPWGVFTVGATIPIAMLMGGYLRFWRIGKVLEASALGVLLLLLAVWGGKLVQADPTLARTFTMKELPLAWTIVGYGLTASVLPVWLLLAPRDYLSTFMKLGTIFALALGIFLVLPNLKMPAITPFTDGTGLVVAGKLFPFCFITIACGAISGFHTLISSGTTPKLITRETYARSIGYGSMCLESLVAIMALIAACTLDPGIYFSMNLRGDPAATVGTVSKLGYPVSVPQMQELAQSIGEQSLFGRTGGAPTLAVGMAKIFATTTGGRWLDIWYHFAIMFEALFILTTIDAGTRVGRYLIQDCLGHFWRPLGRTDNLQSNLLASLLLVAGWGYFLIQGVRDPLGGINSLWPLFGIANQLLASIALCLATTVILKMQLLPRSPGAAPSRSGHPALACIVLAPLIWLLAVTTTASLQKIFSADPRIGFLSEARLMNEKLPALDEALERARPAGPAAVAAAEAERHRNRANYFNKNLDAVVAALLLSLVVIIVLLSLREWWLLLSRRRPAELHESESVWLPDFALREGRPARLAGWLGLLLPLARELSGQGDFERARQGAAAGEGPARQLEARAYLQTTKDRFEGINRCC